MSLFIAACGGSGGSGGGRANEALFASSLMFVGTQLHIYGDGLADFNGDGFDDAAFTAPANVNNQYVDTLYAQRGSSARAIEDPVRIGEGQFAGHGDFNGDGVDDLVAIIPVPNTDDYEFAIHFGRTDGTFEDAVLIQAPVEAQSVGDLAIADVNGDGAADIAMYLYATLVDDPRLITLINAGDGLSFSEPFYQTTDVLVGNLRSADVDQDGFDDLVGDFYRTSSSRFPPPVFVARGVNFSNGIDGFLGWTPAFYEEFIVFPAPVNALSQPYDFTGDGILDFVSSIRTGYIDVYTGTADRTFDGPITTPWTGLEGSIQSHFAFDANDDGALDLVFTVDPSFGHNVSFLGLGNGDGTFGEFVQIPCDLEDPFAVSDVNQDGILDVLTTAHWVTSMRNVYFGDGAGNFSAEQPTPLPVTLASQLVRDPETVLGSVDVDGDDNADLVTISEDLDTLSVLFGQSNGAFNPEITFAINREVTPVDFDGDGAQDFFGLGSMQGYISILRNYGGRDLRMLPPIQLANDVLLDGATEDLDGDGMMDIKVNLPNGVVGIAYGAGDIQFDPVVFVPGASAHHYSYTEDINGDGYTDLVSFQGPWSAPVAVSPAAFSVIPGGLDRTFGAPVLSSAGTSVENGFGFGAVVVFGDLNGDGRVDAVVGDHPDGFSVEPTRMLVYFGQANATLVLQQELSFPHEVTLPHLVDLDRDGDLDLFVFAFNTLMLNVGAGHVLIHTRLNDGDGTFAADGSSAFVSYFLGTQDWTAEVFDITGDDIPDVVTHFTVLGFTVAPGLGDGTFDQPNYFAADATANPVAEDFDHDGDIDFAALNIPRTEIGLFFNRTFRN